MYFTTKSDFYTLYTSNAVDLKRFSSGDYRTTTQLTTPQETITQQTTPQETTPQETTPQAHFYAII